MKVVIAPDSFKGSAASEAVALAVEKGWRDARPGDGIVLLPVADGGEGTVRALVATSGTLRTYPIVTGPIPGQKVRAFFGILQDGKTAVIELAAAAGLTLVPAHLRNPKRTTTYGFGELIHQAVRHYKPKSLILALGGSATNDGGAGALQALGVELQNAAGNQLGQRGKAVIANLRFADFSNASRLPGLEIVIACDVDNPLLGERGATYVFAPQKGATEADLPVLEAAMTRYADVLTEATGRDVRDIPGAGAAGGTAAGLLWLFPQATLRPGIEIVLDAVGFNDAVRDADIVITGEGRLDAQTLGGKAVAGVIRRTRTVNPCAKIIAIVGSVSGDASTLARTLGLDAVYPLVREGVTVDDAVRDAAQHLQNAAERAAHDFSP